MEKLIENLSKKYHNVIADAGYESEENYVYLKKQGLKPFIKPQTYEAVKKKSFRKIIGKRENMVYDVVKDEYSTELPLRLLVLSQERLIVI